ncbi:MAG: ABC transporter permease [Pyrinomonadaceae bacterium]
METLFKDIHYALRGLANRPGFALVVVLTFALGIGANTAIFTVVNSVILRPLPYKDPSHLVVVHQAKEGNSWSTVSYGDFNDFRERQQSFEQLTAFSAPWIFNLSGAGEPIQVNGQWSSANLLSMLGVSPIEGRDFTAADDKEGAQPVVILGYGLWQRQFGGNKAIIGKPINLDDQSFTVIGVAPPNLKITDDTDLWVPLALNRINSRGRLIRYLSVVGRLKPNVTLPGAQNDLSIIAQQLEQQYPDTNKGFAVHLTPMHEEIVGKVRTALFVLLGSVGFVLLIACANVANLTLSRAIARRKEFAIRTTLGAGRRRLIRQLLTESLILSLFGGFIGLILATWGIDLLLSLSPESIPRHQEIGPDRSVLLFTLVLSLLTGLISGVVPAWKAAKIDLNETLKESGQLHGSSARHQRFRRVLIVSEIALALVLLTGSGLLIKSFARLLNVNAGFDTENVLALQLTLPSSKYSQPPQRTDLYQQVETQLKALPGVKAVGAISRMPLFAGDITTGRSNITSTIVVEGRNVAEGDLPEADYRVASPSYFEAINIPLVKGRIFNWQDEPRDSAGRPMVVVINETMARRFWPGEEAIGKRIKWGAASPTDPWWTIVGVVGNVRHFRLDMEPRPELYRPYLVNPLGSPILVVRTSSNPETLAAAVRSAVQAIDPNIPLSKVSTMPQLISRSVAPRRFSMLLLAIFAGVALLLATVGIYGVMSYSVMQRTHEIGIRMALGAQASDVLKLMLSAGVGLALTGVAIGLLGAFLLTRWMTTLLFGVTPTDALTFVMVPLFLIVVALVACFIPARRATKVEPLVALRYE